MILWFHLIGASIWLGGLITLGALVVTLRKEGVDRAVLQAVARQFGRVSWTGFSLAVLSGAWLAIDHLSDPLLAAKVAAVAVTGGLAAYHQFAARNQTPRARGILQGLILLTSLVVFGIGVSL